MAAGVPMTPKRTHGPCSDECQRRSAALGSRVGHQPDCPSLYPGQQEPDALTRLVRLVRQADDISHVPQTATQVAMAREQWEQQALALISEAREEQRKAAARAKNEELEALAKKLIERRDKMRGRAEERGRRIGLEEAASIARSRKDFES